MRAAPSLEVTVRSKIVRTQDGGREAAPVRLRVVGGDVMYLDGIYDPAQLWLDNLGPIIHHVSDDPVPIGPMPSEETARRLLSRMESKWASIQPDDRVLFIPEHGVQQYTLPFREGRVITSKVWQRLNKTNFPCFDRDSNGQTYRVSWARDTAMPQAEKELTAELEARCRGRYYIKRHSARHESSKFKVHFELYIDFVEFMLLA